MLRRLLPLLVVALTMIATAALSWIDPYRHQHCTQRDSAMSAAKQHPDCLPHGGE
jgi:hypothetical protein